jgi:hypothetical protein
MKTVVVGPGVIGGIYGDLFARSGYEERNLSERFPVSYPKYLLAFVSGPVGFERRGRPR